MNQFVSGNQADMLGALQECVSTMRDKRAAMNSLQEISARLLQSISCGDTGSLADVLDARAQACQELGRLFSLRPSFDLDLNGLADAAQPEIKKSATDILESERQLEFLRVQTLAMQSECEEALRAALAVTTRRMQDSTNQKNIRSAYCMPSPSPSRFLDKKK